MAGQQGLIWPIEADARAAVIFDSASGVVNLDAAPGTPVCAVATGTVSVVAGDWLELSLGQMIVSYYALQNITVSQGESVAAGQMIAEVGETGSMALMVLQAIDPSSLFAPRSSLDDTAEVEAAASSTPEVVYVRPTVDGLRVRETPVDGEPVGQIDTVDRLESLESAEETARKLGVEGEWLKLRLEDGIEAYAAAWYLEVVTEDESPAPEEADTPARPIPPVPGVRSLLGMNLDIHHPNGRPDPRDLEGIGWVRLKFNVSYNPENNSYGNRDIEAAYQRYLPFIESYAGAGMKVLMVFTHQLYGEGAGFDWRQMDGGRWQALVPTYADFARQVAERFQDSGLVHCYQIWNEQDTKPEHARAAVPVPSEQYAYMLTEAIRAIRSADESTPIITGGHTTGPGPGSRYAQETLDRMPSDIRPDGIAIHPYGRGVHGHRFSNWGPLAESIEKYGAVMPEKPLWITEWGVLDHQGRDDVIDDVTDYAAGFMKVAKEEFAGKIAATIWYAWADGMDNGFGLFDAQGKPKPRIHDKWRRLG